MKHKELIRGFAAMMLVMCMTSSSAFAGPDPDRWDAKAVEVLKQMDTYTNSLGKFVIKAESYLDATIGEGLVISNAYKTTVSVDRANALHSVAESGLQTNEIYLNKTALTIYTGEQKFYSRSQVPEPLDAGLMFALEELDVETPLLDLLIINALDRLISPETEVVYVTGDSSIRGVECHHILISGRLVDMQVWIEKGDKPVPRRTVMTYKYGEGTPRNEVFLEWSAVDGFDKSEFEFVPPEGATEIDFVDTPVTRQPGDDQ